MGTRFRTKPVIVGLACSDPELLTVISIVLKLERLETVEIKHPQELQHANRTRYDVLLAGELQAASPAEVVKTARLQSPHIPVLALLSETDIEEVVTCIKAGASSVFVKGSRSETLISAIRQAVAAGQSGSDGLADLTPRETQVAKAVFDGLTAKQAAILLGTSYRTVEVHRHRILQKMGAKNTAELVRRLTHVWPSA